jgi:protein-S-isoprenylcysteine O-methyltransferase Ste14
VLSLGVLLARIQAEERLLSQTFGAEYDAYRGRTWWPIPYIYTEPVRAAPPIASGGSIP